MGAEPRGILVIDLDGTLCLGDAPVRAFARFAEEETGLTGLVDGLDQFFAGTIDLGVRDGYQAVFGLARAQGPLEIESMSSAFRRSRTEIATWIDDVWAPPGIAELLGALDGIRRVLVTNSPSDGLSILLPALGVARVLDAIITGARKPARMPEVLDGLQHNAPGAALASIGDIWENDLADVHARGGATFHIDRHQLGDGMPTARAAEAQGLYPAIRAWSSSLAA